jgi:mRNA interferase HigB
VTVLGEAALERFAKQHAAARKPLARFLALAGVATWKHFQEVKQSFPATDYAAATGTLVFNIAGNKFRLIARVDFEEQVLYIHAVMTHEKYNRENL